MSGESKVHASVEEIAKALKQLGPADILQLQRIAQMRSAGLFTFTWEDLLNEAIRRALHGSRRWPIKVAFVAFMAQTMRSIANEEWRRLRDENTSTESDLVDDDNKNVLNIDELAVGELHPGREAVARKLLLEIDRLFQDDPKSIAVIHGLAIGLTPKEIQNKENISSTEYASTQKRIRRNIARHFFSKDFKYEG